MTLKLYEDDVINEKKNTKSYFTYINFKIYITDTLRWFLRKGKKKIRPRDAQLICRIKEQFKSFFYLCG